MTYQDKQLQCVECGNTFTFSAEEQELFASRGYNNDPKRCLTCRQTRKDRRYRNNGYGYRPVRQVFPAVCAQCGKDCEVPFQPREGRPVYCSDCYNTTRVNR